jgi:hypothetical protein
MFHNGGGGGSNNNLFFYFISIYLTYKRKKKIKILGGIQRVKWNRIVYKGMRSH